MLNHVLITLITANRNPISNVFLTEAALYTGNAMHVHLMCCIYTLLGHCSEGHEQEVGREILQEERRCRGTVN